ncbi:hypothetical protein ACQY0O_007518 [Thecaphora frezii]
MAMTPSTIHRPSQASMTSTPNLAADSMCDSTRPSHSPKGRVAPNSPNGSATPADRERSPSREKEDDRPPDAAAAIEAQARRSSMAPLTLGSPAPALDAQSQSTASDPSTREGATNPPSPLFLGRLTPAPTPPHSPSRHGDATGVCTPKHKQAMPHRGIRASPEVREEEAHGGIRGIENWYKPESTPLPPRRREKGKKPDGEKEKGKEEGEVIDLTLESEAEAE